MSLLPLVKRAVATRAVQFAAAFLRALKEGSDPTPSLRELGAKLESIDSWANLEVIPLLREMKKVINDHVQPISVLAFGADPTGTSDSTAAFQAAFDACTNGVGTVVAPPGTYLLSSAVTAANHGVHLKGAGTLQTILQFQPTANGPCIKFASGAGVVISSCSVSDLTFSSTDTTYTKTMVYAEDVSEFRAEHIRGTAWAGASSQGIQVFGREFVYIQDCTLSCPTPLRFSSNPNYPADCSDQTTVFNCYFTATSATDNGVLFDDGITIGPTTMLNVHINGGLNGIYWNDTTSLARSNTLRLIGIRYEQTQGYVTGGWAVYLSKTGAAQGGQVHLEDICGGNANDYNGIYVDGFDVTASNCEFQGTAGVTGLQLGAETQATLQHCRMNLNSATVNYGGNRQALAVPFGNGAAPRSVWVESSANAAAARLISIYGQSYTSKASGGTTYLLPYVVVEANSGSVTPGIIAAGAYYSTSFAATGCTYADYVVATFNGSLISNGVYVSATAGVDTVGVTITNGSGGVVDIGAGTFYAIVMRL